MNNIIQKTSEKQLLIPLATPLKKGKEVGVDSNQTIYRTNEICEESLRNLIEKTLPHANAYLPSLSTGEGWKLSKSLWSDLIDYTLKYAEQKPVYAGVLFPTTNEVLEYITIAKKKRLSGIVVTTPFGKEVEQKEIIEHFEKINETGCSFIIYGEDYLSKNKISFDSLSEITKLSNAVGVKLSYDDIQYINKSINALDLPVYTGRENLYRSTPNGAGGAFALANLKPALCKSFVNDPVSVSLAMREIYFALEQKDQEWYRHIKVALKRQRVFAEDALLKVVYFDSALDLFHRGQLEFIKKAKALGTYLVAGIFSDEIQSSNKERPVISGEDRLEVARNISFVDKCVYNAPGKPDKDFFKKNNLDLFICNAKRFNPDARLNSNNDFKSTNIELSTIPYHFQYTSKSQILNKLTKHNDYYIEFFRFIYAREPVDNKHVKAFDSSLPLSSMLKTFFSDLISVQDFIIDKFSDKDGYEKELFFLPFEIMIKDDIKNRYAYFNTNFELNGKSVSLDGMKENFNNIMDDILKAGYWSSRIYKNNLLDNFHYGNESQVIIDENHNAAADKDYMRLHEGEMCVKKIQWSYKTFPFDASGTDDEYESEENRAEISFVLNAYFRREEHMNMFPDDFFKNIFLFAILVKRNKRFYDQKIESKQKEAALKKERAITHIQKSIYARLAAFVKNAEQKKFRMVAEIISDYIGFTFKWRQFIRGGFKKISANPNQSCWYSFKEFMKAIHLQALCIFSEEPRFLSENDLSNKLLKYFLFIAKNFESSEELLTRKDIIAFAGNQEILNDLLDQFKETPVVFHYEQDLKINLTLRKEFFFSILITFLEFSQNAIKYSKKSQGINIYLLEEGNRAMILFAEQPFDIKDKSISYFEKNLTDIRFDTFKFGLESMCEFFNANDSQFKISADFAKGVRHDNFMRAVFFDSQSNLFNI